jgi:hypothetical protein
MTAANGFPFRVSLHTAQFGPSGFPVKLAVIPKRI